MGAASHLEDGPVLGGVEGYFVDEVTDHGQPEAAVLAGLAGKLGDVEAASFVGDGHLEGVRSAGPARLQLAVLGAPQDTGARRLRSEGAAADRPGVGAEAGL